MASRSSAELDPHRRLSRRGPRVRRPSAAAPSRPWPAPRSTARRSRRSAGRRPAGPWSTARSSASSASERAQDALVPGPVGVVVGRQGHRSARASAATSCTRLRTAGSAAGTPRGPRSPCRDTRRGRARPTAAARSPRGPGPVTDQPALPAKLAVPDEPGRLVVQQAGPRRPRRPARSARRCPRRRRSPGRGRRAAPGRPAWRRTAARYDSPAGPTRLVSRSKRWSAACAEPRPIAREMRPHVSPCARRGEQEAGLELRHLGPRGRHQRQRGPDVLLGGLARLGSPDGEPHQVGRGHRLRPVEPRLPRKPGGSRVQQVRSCGVLGGGALLVVVGGHDARRSRINETLSTRR